MSQDAGDSGHVSDRDTTQLPRSVAATTEPGCLYVVVFFPDELAQCHRADRPLTVGRDPASDIPLRVEATSRCHAEITPGVSGLTVTDLDSRNGTFVDGRRIDRRRIGHGSIVRVGDALIRVIRLVEPWRLAERTGPLVGGVTFEPIRRAINLVGPSDLPVLIGGETGTGKELVARALHSAGARPGPFVPVNCAALPEGLAESELFGHVRGAFSGAQRARKGLFSAASGGTLFLDEIGDIPLPLQAKLLRALEDGVVRPIGSDDGYSVDVRVVSATNRDLSRAMQLERFRGDLFARLAGVEINLPALRERPEDLPALADYLLTKRGHSASCDADAMEILALCDWEQNVRQLDHALVAASLSSGGTIAAADLPDTVRLKWQRARQSEAAPASARPIQKPSSPEDERKRLVQALRETRGNVRQTAGLIGRARGHVYRLLRRWDIDPNDFRDGARIARGTEAP